VSSDVTRFDVLPATPDPIGYLDAAAATTVARDIKQRLLARLDVRPGQTVLDVGCGPGTDLGHLVDAAGPTGSVLGIDIDPAMVDAARRRFAGVDQVEVQPGDAHALDLPTASVDRARADRILQHVDDPAQVLTELRRVIRPGGLVGLAEPDWDTLAVDDVDLETSRAFTRFVSGKTRTGTIGRQLTRLATAAGLSVSTVEAHCVLFRDFDAGEQLLGLRRNAVRAVQAGRLSPASASGWLDRLTAGEFLASFTFYTVTARG
jgi:ubiquinone/menaquinone biosynthesis C-methylase UbiE